MNDGLHSTVKLLMLTDKQIDDIDFGSRDRSVREACADPGDRRELELRFVS